MSPPRMLVHLLLLRGLALIIRKNGRCYTYRSTNHDYTLLRLTADKTGFDFNTN